MKYQFRRIISIAACLMAVNVLYAQDAPQAGLTPSANPVATGQTITLTVTGYCDSGLGQIGLELCDASGTPTANLGWASVSDIFDGRGFAWTAPAPGSYNFDSYAWNSDYSQLTRSPVTTITVTALPLPHCVSLAASPNPVLNGQVVKFAAHAIEPSGNLLAFSFYINGPGYPGWNYVGSVGVSGADATASFSWTPPSSGAWAVEFLAWDADYNVDWATAQFQSAPVACKVLIDTNQLSLDDMNDGRLSQLAADGVWVAPPGSNGVWVGPTTISQYASMLTTLNANSWAITEDGYWDNIIAPAPGLPSTFSTFSEALNHPPNQAMVYYEPSQEQPGAPTAGPTGGFPDGSSLGFPSSIYSNPYQYPCPNDTILLSGYNGDGSRNFDQIKKIYDLLGGQTAIDAHSRSYVDGGSLYRRSYTQMALQSPYTGGISFEFDPEQMTADNPAYEGPDYEGIRYFVGTYWPNSSPAKKCYLLLAPNNENSTTMDYLTAVKGVVSALRSTGQLGNPNLYIVLAAYNRENSGVSYYPKYPDDPNSLLVVRNWLKGVAP
jgi:hypothetical protein